MYVLAIEETVETYPYSVADLKRDNPNVSFPRYITDELLADWNVFPVVERGLPDYNPATENIQQINPTFENDQWVTNWLITPVTAGLTEQRTEDEAEEVRHQRDQLLIACDWTQLTDSPLTDAEKTAWSEYRQELRAVPQQESFPWEVVWPSTPNS